MNKKLLNIVLIVVVCGIWSVVIYRFIKNQSSQEMVIAIENQAGPVADFSTKREDFTLSSISRDPFLDGTTPVRKVNKGGRNLVSGTSHQTNSGREKIQNAVQVVDVAPMNLRFQGVVKNNTTNATVALIAFNGKSVRLSPGQIHEGYKLEKIYRDSVMLTRNKERIIARK